MVLDIVPSFTLLQLHFHRGSKESRAKFEKLRIPAPMLNEDADLFSLLRWSNAVSDFVGRDREMEQLETWMTSAAPMSLRFVVGPGGVGKTRLAAEFGRRMDKRRGWDAGFIRLGERRDYALGDKGTLLLLDYPEEQFEQVDQLFDELCDLREQADPPRLRLLFLTRSDYDGWRQRALDHGVADLLSRTEILPGELAAQDAARIVNSAQANACKQTACQGLAAPEPFTPEAIDVWTRRRPEHGRPLFLVAAGIYSALHPDQSACGYSGPEIIDALVDREHTRLRKASGGLFQNKTALPRLLTLATLAGGAAWKTMREAWTEVRGLLPAPDAWDDAGVLRAGGWLAEGRIAPVTPDIVGAAFAVKVLADAEDDAPELAYCGARLAADPEEFINTLARLDDDARFVLGLRHSLPEWLRRAVAGSVERCRRLDDLAYNELPHSLAPLAVSIGSTLLQGDLPDENRAHLLNNLSAFLSGSGDNPAALQASQEAVDIRRALANENPARFRPELALSLNNLSNCLSDSGDNPAALQASQEAANIYRALAKENPARFRPDLAMSLNNLSNRLSNSGDNPAALQASQEAANIYRALAKENPARFRPDLAMSLNNLSTFLSDSGDNPAALQAIQEAVNIRRALAKENPARFRPDLALSLNNLSLRLADSGDNPAALQASQEAANIYRALAKENPARFRPDLAMSLNNLSNRLSNSGDNPAALQASQEAANIYRALAKENSARFRPDLAMSLNNLSLRLADSGDHPAALQAIQEAVDIRSALATETPARFRPNLATSYGAQGLILSKAGEWSAAAESFRQGMELLRPFAEAHPGTPHERIFLALKDDYERTSQRMEADANEPGDG